MLLLMFRGIFCVPLASWLIVFFSPHLSLPASLLPFLLSPNMNGWYCIPLPSSPQLPSHPAAHHPISQWRLSPGSIGCLFDTAQSVEHMKEGWHGLIAIGQLRRQADKEKESLSPHVESWRYGYYHGSFSLTWDLWLEFLVEITGNCAKNQRDLWHTDCESGDKGQGLGDPYQRSRFRFKPTKW